MSEVINRDKLKRVPVIEKANARFIHGNDFTLAFWELEKGAVFPLHSHPHEMSPNIMKGSIELRVDGKSYIMKKGDSFLIPPNAKHEAIALEPTEVIDVFTPVREDYRAMEEESNDDGVEMYLDNQTE